MKLINQVLRGVVIGVANIIPGVSGGTMMVSMGIYDTLIHCITHLFSEFRQSVKTLLPYAVGMLLGIVALASLLKFLFANYPLPTSTTFIGLILGGLNPLLAKIRHKKLGGVSIGVFVLFFAGIIAMALTGDVSNPDTITVVWGVVILLVMGRGCGCHDDHPRRIGQHGADAAGLLSSRAQRRGHPEKRCIRTGLCRHGRSGSDAGALLCGRGAGYFWRGEAD